MAPDVIADLYRAFSDVRRPSRIDACPCCMGDTEICTLLTRDLASITPEEISAYAAKVFLTVGAEADFHYFLPRILDILSSNSRWWPDPEVVGRAIATFGWDKFSAGQQNALLAFFGSAFSTRIFEVEVHGSEIDSWLCGLSHFLPTWEGLLRQVEHHPPALIALYEWHSSALTRGALANDFWSDSHRQQDFKNWLIRLVDEGAINTAYGL